MCEVFRYMNRNKVLIPVVPNSLEFSSWGEADFFINGPYGNGKIRQYYIIEQPPIPY